MLGTTFGSARSRVGITWNEGRAGAPGGRPRLSWCRAWPTQGSRPTTDAGQDGRVRFGCGEVRPGARVAQRGPGGRPRLSWCPAWPTENLRAIGDAGGSIQLGRREAHGEGGACSADRVSALGRACALLAGGELRDVGDAGRTVSCAGSRAGSRGTRARSAVSPAATWRRRGPAIGRGLVPGAWVLVRGDVHAATRPCGCPPNLEGVCSRLRPAVRLGERGRPSRRDARGGAGCARPRGL